MKKIAYFPLILAFPLLAYAEPKPRTPKAPALSFEELMEQGRSAFMNYDFDLAEEKFDAAERKSDNTDDARMLELYQHRLELAQGFLDRVEKLVILDSIAVPKAEFFKAYRLPESAGSLSGAEGLPFPVEGAEYVFTNEGDDFKMWAQPDSTGVSRIAESIRLTDGKWHEPVFAPDDLGAGGNTAFPFMMADGVTLYFASDGEESMGGYDIFVASRDATDGEYLQPQNIGMPYNSPYDDYLLAIDELNGVGWWATDRNLLGDNLTVYLFKVNDLRSNYNPDEDNVADLARISDFRATQDPDEDYSELMETVGNITRTVRRKADFHFPMKGGVVYSSLEDFKTSSGKTMMKKFLAVEKELREAEDELAGLRRDYASKPGASLESRIRKLEADVERRREAVKKARNDVYRAEGN